MAASHRSVGWVLMAIAVLLLASAVAIRMRFTSFGSARHMAVQAEVTVVGTALELYRAENGAYPSTQQGLAALVTQPLIPSRTSRWTQRLRDVPKDPWGASYIYRCPGIKHPDKYDLFSVGTDGIADTGDDDWGK
jgi:general secretion pathway protein G